MSGSSNNRQGGGKRPNSPRYSERYGKGHVNPYLGGQPRQDMVYREIEERQNAVRAENEMEARAEREKAAREAERNRVKEAAQQTPAAGSAQRTAAEESGRAAHGTARRRTRDNTRPTGAAGDPEMQARLRRIQEQAMKEARAISEGREPATDGFDDADTTPDVKLRLSEDNKPLIALESRGADGRLEVKWIPVMLSEEDMETFFPAIEPVQDTRGIKLEEKKELEIKESKEPAPDEDGLVLIPIAGVDDVTDAAAAAVPVAAAAAVELLNSEAEPHSAPAPEKKQNKKKKERRSPAIDELPVITLEEAGGSDADQEPEDKPESETEPAAEAPVVLSDTDDDGEPSGNDEAEEEPEDAAEPEEPEQMTDDADREAEEESEPEESDESDAEDGSDEESDDEPEEESVEDESQDEPEEEAQEEPEEEPVAEQEQDESEESAEQEEPEQESDDESDREESEEESDAESDGASDSQEESEEQEKTPAAVLAGDREDEEKNDDEGTNSQPKQPGQINERPKHKRRRSRPTDVAVPAELLSAQQPEEQEKPEEQPEAEEAPVLQRRTAVAARPVYDQLDTSSSYSDSRYREDDGQDDGLFIRKDRPGSTALFMLPGGANLPKYIDDDDFVERWLGDEEEEDMASDSKRRRRRISTIIGAVTMLLALVGFIAVAKWGIGLLSSIGNTDTQKEEYARFISPIVMSEVPVFETWDAIPQDKLLQSAVFNVLDDMDITYERDDTGKLIIPSTDVVNSVKELYGAYSADPAQDDEINTQIRNALYGSAGEDTTNADVYYVDMEDSFHVSDGLSGPAPEVTDIFRRDNTITLTVQYLEDLEGGSGGILYAREYILTLDGEGYYVQALREYEE